MPKEPKVLHVYRTFFPDTQGGLEEVIRQICIATNDLGYKSSVFTLSDFPEPKRVDVNGIEVFRFKKNLEISSCGMSISAFTHFKKIAPQFDLINYHFPWPFADLLNVYLKFKTKHIITYHSDIIRQQGILNLLYFPLMKKFLDSAECIVATSPNYMASSEVLKKYSFKTSVIPIGLNERNLTDISKKKLTEFKLRFGNDFFIFIGVLRYYKGLHILLDALAGTKIKCLIVGRGPLKKKLIRKAKSLGLNNVHFLGFVSDEDKSALLNLSRAVIFPSHLRSEAFGVTLLEGAIHGKPLITTEIGTGTSYVNLNGETGLVVSPNNAGELRDAMLKIADDDELAMRFGKASRKRYERLFTAERMGMQYVKLYDNLLNR